MKDLLLELLQVSLSTRDKLSRMLMSVEWNGLFEEAQKHTIEGFLLAGMGRLPKEQMPEQDVLLEWIGVGEMIRQRNVVLNKRCIDLQDIFEKDGYKCCILKGQGNALLYPDPLLRQSGDIDIWVTKDGKFNTDDLRSEILQFAKSYGYHIGHVDIKHSDIDIFEDVPVEVHYIPSWMFSPFKNKRLQRFFAEQTDSQFRNKDIETGFIHTTIEFDLVFSLVHIFRHVFEGGIGLRQLLDYYHILIHSGKQQRKDAYTLLDSLGMGTFAGGIVYILRECFKLDEKYFICEPNERHGRFLMPEILAAGNFGHFDNRYQHKAVEKRFSNGLITLKRDMHYLCYYPSEVLWMPFWKIWHWYWRKKKGYL